MTFDPKPMADRLAQLGSRLRQALRRRPGGQPAAAAPAGGDGGALDASLRGWRITGWMVVGGFVGGFLLWSAVTRLDAAAIAQGVVGVESNRKTVAHLEGGIVKHVHVGEGDRVAAGEVLVSLDDTQPRAALRLLDKRRLAALAEQARLRAERDGGGEIVFPDELLDRAAESDVADLLVSQVDLLHSRRDRVSGQETILRERMAKLRQEIRGHEAQLAAQRERLSLLREEQQVLEPLGKKGLVAKTKLLELRRAVAETKGSAGEYAARIARDRDAMAEIRAQLAQPRDLQRNQVADNMSKVQERLAELDEQIAAARDVLTRTEVRAPTAGRVVDLRIHTPGGVVRPGEPLLDLVPDTDTLVVDLRIDPRDIDIVHEGMPAQVRLTAFSSRTTPPLDGTLVSVSADRVSDPANGRAYFIGRVAPDADSLGRLRLSPGMQAEVFLVAAERTVLDYLVEPLVRSLHRAGREF